MDRFKFRVWDIRRKLYITNGTIDMRNGIFATLGFEEAKKFIPEQCTGLKDKNGKLIYEGDILKIKWNNDDYPRYYEVKFEDGAFGIEPLKCNDWLDSEYISDISQETLIIGNIHENPELLEEK